MLRVWYQASRLILLFGHPSDTPMQAWALGGPVAQLGHSLPSPLPTIWYSKITLTDTPPLAKLCKMNIKTNKIEWLDILMSELLLAYTLNYNLVRLTRAMPSSTTVWAMWSGFTDFWKSRCVQMMCLTVIIRITAVQRDAVFGELLPVISIKPSTWLHFVHEITSSGHLSTACYISGG